MGGIIVVACRSDLFFDFVVFLLVFFFGCFWLGLFSYSD